jgi:hypothetical protein
MILEMDSRIVSIFRIIDKGWRFVSEALVPLYKIT